MRRKLLLSLLSTTLAAISLVMLLYYNSQYHYLQHGGFYRSYPPHITERKYIINLQYNSFYFCGNTNHNLYLGNYTLPNYALALNQFTHDTLHQRFSLDTALLSNAMHLSIDSPNVYLTDGIARVITVGKMNDKTLRSMTDQVSFSKIIPLSNQRYIIRRQNEDLHVNILEKINLASQQAEASHILKKQVDGYFLYRWNNVILGK